MNNEGVDVFGRVVYINPEHQKIVNTNNKENSVMFKAHRRRPMRLVDNNTCVSNGYDVYSIFKRGINSYALLNAIKKRRGFKFGNENDANVLLFNAVYALTHNQAIFSPNDYDVFVMAPSNNPLNHFCFEYLSRLFPDKVYYSELFTKLRANTVWRQIDFNLIQNIYSNNPHKVQEIYTTLRKAFVRMNKLNDGFFFIQIHNAVVATQIRSEFH